ncbi:MAG: ABC transporter substrate-binding protein, partial [Pseudomonadota bacterium]|nr:ABC transporter substrate-binding protein [Pseudomonadota bacterium]
FMQRTGRRPNMIHAGTYSAVSQYLKAVQKAGTDNADAVTKALREMPVQDFFARNGKVLPNGRMVHDMYLFEVKKPSESKGTWDYFRHLATIPGDEAFEKPEASGCPLVKS